MCFHTAKIALVLSGLMVMTTSCARAQKAVEFVVDVAMVPQVAIGPVAEGVTALVFIEARSPVSLSVVPMEGIKASVTAEPQDAALRESFGRRAAMPFHATYRLFVQATGNGNFLKELGLTVLDDKKNEQRRVMIAVANQNGTLFLSRERALTLRQFIDALELGKAGKR